MIKGLEGKRWLAGRVAGIHASRIGRHVVLKILASGKTYLLPLSKCECPPGHEVYFNGEELCEAEFCREFIGDVFTGSLPGVETVGSIPTPLRLLGPLREDTTHPLALYEAGGTRIVVKGYREVTGFNHEPRFYHYLRHRGITPPFKAYYRIAGVYMGLIMGHVEGEDGGRVFYEALKNSISRGDVLVPEEAACRVARVLAVFHASMLDCREEWCLPGVVDAGDVEAWRRRLRFYYSRIGSPLLEERYRKALEGLKMYRGSVKARIHQDFHLSQLMRTGDKYLILDFEGEPGRPEEWRGLLEPPLRDFASLLRSLSYIAFFAVKEAFSLSMEEAGRKILSGDREAAMARKWGMETARLLAHCYIDGLSSLGGDTAAVNAGEAEELLELTEPWYVERGLYEAYYESMYRKKNVIAAVTTLAAKIPI